MCTTDTDFEVSVNFASKAYECVSNFGTGKTEMGELVYLERMKNCAPRHLPHIDHATDTSLFLPPWRFACMDAGARSRISLCCYVTGATMLVLLLC